MASAHATKETCEDGADTAVSEVCRSFYTSLEVLPSSEAPAAVESIDVSSAASISSNQYYSARTQWMMENRNKFASQVDFEIECSKVHHTSVHEGEGSGGDEDIDEEEDERELDEEILQANRKTINELKDHPLWWLRFRGFLSEDRSGDFEVREKIGQGGEATIYAGIYKCVNLWDKHVVVKVYRRGYYLRDLVKQWPVNYPNVISKLWATYIEYVMLMPNDGRIAMVMKREWGDLRQLIDLKKEANHNQGPPFDLITTVALMLEIASTMEKFHSDGVVHRDLKASNVLVCPSKDHLIAWESNVAAIEPPLLGKDSYSVKVSDYECALGVMGTRFWRAPEVLLGIRDTIKRRSSTSLFTKESDVYSYGMLCYEIATGFLPFEREGFTGTKAEQDRVIRGERPTFPNDVDSTVKDLISRCWQQDESARPTFMEIPGQLLSIERDIKECSQKS